VSAVNLVAGVVLAMLAPPGQGGVEPTVRMGRRTGNRNLKLSRAREMP
jgi:hypothetical protein